MANARRAGLVLAGTAILIALFLFLRGRGDDSVASPTETVPTETAPPPTTTEPRPATTSERPTPPLEPQSTVVRIAIRGGSVAGGVKRVELRKGTTVVIAVSSDDVSDHVHVHGYDLFKDVGPGRPARFRFRARLAGRFEVELEERSLPIAELEVRP